MTAEGFKRKLTVVFSADVAGYSRLMGENEAATVKCLEEYKGVMFTLIKQHRGRVIDSPGDNLLAEFGSVVDAAQCAVAVQKELHARNLGLPENRRMQFRIGINLGDVIEEQDRIYGDGVNIAARLEALADPGGICISKTAFDQIESKLPLGYQYLGEQAVKNITKPIGAYRVMMEPRVTGREEKEIERASEDRMASPFKDKPSIAVLPFVNMSNDSEQEYFSDGMSEEIISALAKLEGMKVISRTSAFYFKGKDVDLRTIGQKLKVENVLEGSVRKAGNRLRITAQLIRVADDTHLWSETYNRELEDVFAIQDEISQAIVQSLRVQLMGRKTEPLVKDYTQNTEAYDLFLKGRYFENKGFFGYEKAIECMEKAVQADPDFAQAYSKLALIHYHNSIALSLSSKEMWPKIKTLTRKALAIDEMDADAHASLGLIKSLREYDWKGAEISYKRAIELNPANSDAHLQYAQFLAGQGRIDEAVDKMIRAIEHDPFSVFSHAMLSLIFYMGHKFDKAITQSYKALELAPNDPTALIGLAMSHAAKGMYDEGIKILQPVIKIPIVLAFVAILYGKTGKREEAQKILEDLLERSKHGNFSPLMIATIYGSLENKDKAFEWLEKAFEERDVANCWIKVEPVILANLRADPRWAKLMGKMGLGY